MLIKEKIEQAIEILREFEVDCWLTFVRESELVRDPSLDYILGRDVTWHSAFILTSAGESYALVGELDKQGILDIDAYQTVLGHDKGIKQLLQETLQRLNPATIAINYSEESEICDGITHGLYLTLHKYLTEIGFADRLIPSEPVVSALRERKTATEIALIKEAIRITEDIFAQVANFIRPGRTEKEIAAFMVAEMERANVTASWNPANCPAVFSGPDAVGGHCGPTDRRVEPGHLLFMDFGVRYKGYCSDLQRTFYLLQEGETTAPPNIQAAFEDVVTSIELARQALKPGVQGIDIDKISRGYLLERGYQEFMSALGHQVGRFAHDGTALLGPPWEKYTQRPYQKIEPGMVFTMEPRADVPGHGMVSLEDMVVVTETGAEFLSTPQKELLLIPQEESYM